MRFIYFRRLLLGGLVLAIVGAVGLVIGFSMAVSQPAAFVPPSPTGAAIPSPMLAPTRPPTPTSAPTRLPTPTIDSNLDITPDWARVDSMLVVHPSPQPPKLTQQEALQSIYNLLQVDWALGRGEYKGRLISTTAIYGLVTIGGSADLSGFWVPPDATVPPACKNWTGPCNIPLRKCDDKGVCIPTGQVLGHYENRPAWLIGYNNVPFSGSCAAFNVPCPTYAFSVFILDEETRTIANGGFSHNIP